MSHRAGIPASWAVTRIGDVVEAGVEQRRPGPKSASYVDIGSIDRGTKRIGETQNVNASTAPTRARQWIKEGDVLVSMTRPNLNAVAIVPAELDGAVASTGFDVLRAVGMEPGWLFARVRSTEFISDICKDLQGVVYPAIRPRDVRDHRLPVAPLPEQRRVLDALDSYLSRLDETTTLLDRVQRNLKRYRASVLKAAVEGRLVPTEAELARAEKREYEPASVLLKRILVERRRRWGAEGKRGKYQEPEAPDTKELPELPKGWCRATVEQLGFVVSGQTPKEISDCLLPAGEVPWFRVGDMNTAGNEVFMRSGRDWLSSVSVERLGLHVQPAGTIIFPKRGGAIATNKKRRLAAPSAYDLNTMGVVPAAAVADYLWLWFLGLNLGRLSDGSNVPQINHGDIAPLPVPLPPLSEQPRIISEVERLFSLTDDAVVLTNTSRVRCQRLRQSILKWAFEGKLVDQDPNDEPAADLLARIKGEKGASPSKTSAAPPRIAKRKP